MIARVYNRLRDLLEWQRLARFVAVSRWRAVVFIGLSLLSDALVLAVPYVVIVALAAVTGMGGAADALPGFASALAEPVVALPLAFALLCLQQAASLGAEVIIRQMDRLFFARESDRIYARYAEIPLYLEDLSDKMKPGWFSKNIARNVRHTSEAMQGQLRMVPQVITLVLVAGALAVLSPAAAAVILPIAVIAGVLLTPRSRAIFNHSRQHFEVLLPAFGSALSRQLTRVYREPQDTELPDALPPQFGHFLDSRYRLHVLRAMFAAFSAVVLGGMFLAVVLAIVMFGQKGTSGLGMQTIALMVILLLQAMNKARALIGNVGSIASLYPQIKMSREIQAHLETSREAWQTRVNREDAAIWERLHFLTQVKMDGGFTRFNLLKLLEVIESHIGAEGTTLPMEQLAFIRASSLDRHFEELDIRSAHKFRVLNLLKRLRKAGKRVVIMDWATLNEMTAKNVETLHQTHKGLRIIVPTAARIPQSWRDVLLGDYDAISDVNVASEEEEDDFEEDFSDD